MKKKYLSKAIMLVFLITSFCGYSTTYYSIGTGNWNTPGTWSIDPILQCGGAASVTAPGAGDDVVICIGNTVTMDGAPGACLSLTIRGTANWTAANTTNVGAGGITFISGGDITDAASAGILTTTGGLVLSGTLTSALVTIKTITTAGQTISGTGSMAKLDISANTTNNGDLTVTTTLASTTASTLTQGGTAVLTYKGTTVVVPALSANAGSNTVIYGSTSGNQTVKTSTYQNLTFNGATSKTLGGAITVNGNLTVNAGSLLTSTFQITGNATGIFTLAAGTFFYIGNTGSATNVLFPTLFTNANISCSATSTVVYRGLNAQTVSYIPTYGHLTINTYTGSKIADGNLTVLGDLVTSSPSILSMTTYTLNLTGGYLYVSPTVGTGGLSFTSGNFNIGGTYTNTGTFTCGTGTVTYNGGGGQMVHGTNYNNLTFSGAGTKTLENATIGIAGDFVRGTMTVTPGTTNTVLFNGGVQNMTGAATTFSNLTLANTSLTIPADITINTALTFTTGNILTAANNVILPATGSVSRTSGHVEGNLRKFVSAGLLTRTFEVGTGSDYTPLDVVFASVSNPGYLTATTTSGDHSVIASSGFNPLLTINRFWTLTNASIVYSDYNVTCNFVDTDIDVGVTTSACVVSLYDGASWTTPVIGTQGANATQATVVTIPATPNTIDLQIGEVTSQTLYSREAGLWSASSTWSYTSGGLTCGCIPTTLADVVIETFSVTMDGNTGGAKSLTINSGGVAAWTSALTTNIGLGGITINAGGDISGAFAGILTTTGGLTLNATLTSTLVTIKTLTTAGQLISGTGSLAKLDISANTTNNGNLTVTTTLASTIASTLTQGTSAILTYLGNPISPTLDASAGTNTVNYSGTSNQIVKAATYKNLNFNGNSSKTLGGAITVLGNLNVNAGSLLTSTYQITGNGSSTFTLAAGTFFYIGDIASATDVTFPIFLTNTFSATSTVLYQGNNGQTISSLPTYGHLTIKTFSGSKAANGNLTVTGNLDITSPSVFDMTTYTLNLTNTSGSYSGTGSLSFTTGIFNIYGAWNTGSFTCGTGTVNYQGGTQTVRGVTYNNLIFPTSGTKTLGGAISVNGNLTVNLGTLSTSTFQITGNVTGTFTLAASTIFNVGLASSATNVTFPTLFTNAHTSLSSTSIVYYTGNNAQTVSSVPTYGGLRIQTYSGSKTADGNITVAGNLLVTSPTTLDMTTYTLDLTSGSYSSTGGLSFTSGTFNITGAFTNSGAFTCGSGTVNYNGTQTIKSGITYNNIGILGAGTKTLAGTLNLNGSLNITSALDVSASNYAINVGGDWSNSGAFTPRSGTVTFNGSGLQTINGSATNTFYDLTINNAAGVNQSGTAAAVTNALTVTTGNLGNTSGTFTLTSDASKYARIAPVGGSFSGNFTIEKYIPARASVTWANLSSPVSNNVMQDWDDELYFLYPFTAYWDMRPEGSNVYSYDEVSALYTEVNAGTSLSTSGKGFEIGLANDGTMAAFSARTLTSIGTPNYGTQVIPLNYTAGQGGAYALDPINNWAGENLIGNPFASAIDLSLITKTGALADVDVYDNATNNYVTLTGAAIIGPHQGFWAYTSGNASGSFTIPESAKSTNSSTNIRSVERNQSFLQLTLSIADGSNTMAHTLKVACATDANDDWDLKDHPFRKSINKQAPNITAYAGKRPLSISTFNNNHETYTMPINVQVGIAGKYQINTTGAEFVNTDYSCVLLEDKVSHQFTDLNTNTNYTFFATPSDLKDRFALHFSKSGNCKSMNSPTTVNNLDNQVQVLQNSMGNTINFNYDKTLNTTITVTNILGQNIIEKLNIEATTQRIHIALPEDFHGLYIIKVKSEKAETVKKFVKP